MTTDNLHGETRANARDNAEQTRRASTDETRRNSGTNGRVSTRDQHPEAQHDALVAAGCEQIYLDHASGTLARRPELDKALLSANRTGDQLVITKLDRLGRFLENLIDLSHQLQDKQVDLVVLDQGIDTSTAVGKLLEKVVEIVQKREGQWQRMSDGGEPNSNHQPSSTANQDAAAEPKGEPEDRGIRPRERATPAGRAPLLQRRLADSLAGRLEVAQLTHRPGRVHTPRLPP